MNENSKHLDFYSFFTKFSLMEDYGFLSGLLNRIFGKVLPEIPNEGTIEFSLLQTKSTREESIKLLKDQANSNPEVLNDLNLSMTALGAKVVAFGLDNKIKGYFDLLSINSNSFNNLANQLTDLSKFHGQELEIFQKTLSEIEKKIILLRKNKSRIGTSLHLTVTTRSILEYLKRLENLAKLRVDLNSESSWSVLLENYFDHHQKKNSLRQFFSRHTDLLALEIVEHNANKGEKYIAESRKEYWSFLFRAILGGGIISIFALIKIYADHFEFTQIQSALLYSLNYALCFIVVKKCGGIIATKQPAVTASTLAKGIDRENDLRIDSMQGIVLLVRKVFRSQFISIVGNFLMAILFAIIICLLLKSIGLNDVIDSIKPDYLIKNTLPSCVLIFYASIAGVFLALSGLISGYVDNLVLASRFSHRIKNSSRFFKGPRLANFVENKAGALIGNISLGFLLGSIFLLSHFLPFSVDIRHIAFSSANIGYAVTMKEFPIEIIIKALLGALCIGGTNFLISFSITLNLALKSRGASLKILPTLIFQVVKDFFKHPHHYFFFFKS